MTTNILSHFFKFIQTGYKSFKTELLNQHKANKVNVITDHEKIIFYMLLSACKQGQLDTIKLLVEQKVDVNLNNKKFSTKMGNTPLILATMWEHVDCVNYLLENGANVNFPDFYNYTSLHFAVELKSKSTTILDMLIAAGGDVSFSNHNKLTPLHFANTANAINKLIKAGAQIDCPNEDNETALHFAISRGYDPDCIEALIQAGFNIEYTNNKGDTPLLIAATQGNIQAFQILLKYNANIEHINNQNNSITNLAQNHNKPQIIELLRTHINAKKLYNELTHSSDFTNNHLITKPLTIKKIKL